MVLQIWFDKAPPVNKKLNAQTCQDFIDFTKSNHILICTSLKGKKWNDVLAKWRKKFDNAFKGAGKFDEILDQWRLPAREPIPELGRHAIDFLEGEPDCLLRAILGSEKGEILSNAQEFNTQLSIITSNSRDVQIFDRYLLMSSHDAIFKVDDGEIVYESKFNEGEFSIAIRGLDLILNSIGSKVEDVRIYSEMLSFAKFKNSVRSLQAKGKLPKKFDVNSQWDKWYNNSIKARKSVADFIAQKLTTKHKVRIEFLDCSTDSEYSEMAHDRFIKYSQGQHISSGGFSNVPRPIQDNELQEIELLPKTYLLKVILDSTHSLPSDVRGVLKKTLTPTSV